MDAFIHNALSITTDKPTQQTETGSYVTHLIIKSETWTDGAFREVENEITIFSAKPVEVESE